MILDHYEKYKNSYIPLILVITISIGIGIKVYGVGRLDKYIKRNGRTIFGLVTIFLITKLLLDTYGFTFNKQSSHHIEKIVTVET